MSINPTLASQLQQAGIVTAEKAITLSQSLSPWWLKLLMGFAAWIASLFIISSFLGPLLALADNNTSRLLAAAMLLTAAIWLATKSQEFLQQMSVAIALAGQGLLVYAVYELSGNNDVLARYASAMLSGLLLFSPLNPLHQRVSLSISTVCLLSLLSSAALLAIVSSALAAVSIWLWCNRQQWAGLASANRIKSMLDVTSLAALGLTLFGQCLLVIDSSFWLDEHLASARTLYSMLGSIVLISTVFWLSRQATAPSRLALITISTLLCIVLYAASGLLVSTALMLACFYGCSKRWAALCVLSMLFAISQFYYSLELSLLHKSGLLALSGVLVLAAWLLVQRYQRRLV